MDEAREAVTATDLDKAVGAVILFGPPGAGKGTQARQVALRLGVPHISTGDIIRAEVAAGTPLGKKVRATMERGDLISDELVNQLVEERLQQADSERGFVLDGYPRTRGQAQVLEAVLDSRRVPVTVFNLDIGYNQVIQRIAGRRSCPSCGTIYNVYLQPSLVPDVCDRDQTPLVTRTDDREEVVRERLLEYEKQTRSVIDFFREQGRIVRDLDGSLPAKAISEQLCKMLSPA